MNIVVTGSSTGIGRALTEHLLAGGHQLWGIARSEQSSLSKIHPERFRWSSCDVADWGQWIHVAAEIGHSWTAIDGLITCAGIQGAIGPTVSVDPLLWSQTIRANLDGTFFALRALHPLLQKSRRAKVACFSGGGATKARANFSAYGAAKTAVVRLVETVAEECQGQPLDINAIAPGAINTRLTDEVLALGPQVVGEAEYQGALKQKATGGAPLSKVLGLVDYLLKPESDGITGRLISAPWDPWASLQRHAATLTKSDIYTLRRILPEERGAKFD